MRRGISEDRASKLALIQRLAEARKDKESSGSATKRRPIIGLSDSEDEEDENTIQAGFQVDSSDDEHPTAAAHQQPTFSRIRRHGDAPRATRENVASIPTRKEPSTTTTDDLAADLSRLGLAAPPTLKNKPTGDKGGSKPSSSLPPHPSSTFNTHQSHNRAPSASPSVASPPPAAAAEEGCLVLGDRGEFRLDPTLSAKLYPHQIAGMSWLFGLWRVGSGGILADDMGLGKTMQTSAFLSGLLTSGLARRALILAPTTLIPTWEKELKACGLGGETRQYIGTAGERERAMRRVAGSGGRGVLLATYGMVQHNAEALAQHAEHDPDDGPLWDLIVMDEGHKLKNPKMQLRARVELLPTRQRIILSGTPIQNNLMEMHALFDLVCPELLGDARDFKARFERRITAGSDKHATAREREAGAATAAELRKIVAPYMLRREKKDVFGGTDAITSFSSSLPPSAAAGATNAAGTGRALPSVSSSGEAPAAGVSSSASSAASPGAMPRKNDFVVWLRLKPNQRSLYEAFLHSDSVREVLNRTRSPLASLTVLKKICDHPALLSEKAAETIVAGAERAVRRAAGGGEDASSSSGSDSEGECIERDEEEVEDGEVRLPREGKRMKEVAAAAAAAEKEEADARALWSSKGAEEVVMRNLHSHGLAASCKTAFVLALLRRLVAEGHRSLVFSQSRVMLDILEAAARAEGWRLCRIDGGIPATERAARVDAFQSDPGIPVFLLTSQVGGLGLTLTAADRVIVVDPAWNPSVDAQSVDRAYRLGQTRDVVVYRLISCGTVEDKIYRKQVFKGGLSRTGTEEGEQFRYFSAAELRDMFQLEPAEAVRSSTQAHLAKLHAHQRQSTPELDAHLSFLGTLEGFAGVSDHDLLYSVKEVEGGGAGGPPEGPKGAAYRAGGGAFAAVTPSRKPRAGGSAVVRGGKEWSGGGGDIAAMFSRALTLSGDCPPGARDAAVALERTKSGDYQVAEALLKIQVEKQEALLANPTLVRSLSDGGAKIRMKLGELKSQLARLPSMDERGAFEEALNAEREEEEARLEAGVQREATTAASVSSAAALPENAAALRPAAASQLRPSSPNSLLLDVPLELPSVPYTAAAAPAVATAAASSVQAQLGGVGPQQQQVKVLKRELFERAKELAAAQGDPMRGDVAALRREVEELNEKYMAAKHAANI